MLLCQPREIQERSEVAEVQVLDLERLTICEIGAEGRENIGVGQSIHTPK